MSRSQRIQGLRLQKQKGLQTLDLHAFIYPGGSGRNRAADTRIFRCSNGWFYYVGFWTAHRAGLEPEKRALVLPNPFEVFPGRVFADMLCTSVFDASRGASTGATENAQRTVEPPKADSEALQLDNQIRLHRS